MEIGLVGRVGLAEAISAGRLRVGYAGGSGGQRSAVRTSPLKISMFPRPAHLNMDRIPCDSTIISRRERP